MYKLYLFSIAFLVLFFSSCETMTETLDDETLGYNYAPMEIGNMWEYQNDSIIYTQGGATIDTFSSIIREEVIDTFRNAENELTYSIARIVKKDTLPWSQPRIWTANKNTNNYIRTEENLKFVKLVFPTQLGASWEGDIYFDESTIITVAGEELMPYRYWDYRIEENNLSYDFGSISSADVIKVGHILYEDFYEKRFSEELYARNIGLVYKKMIILDAQCDPVPCGDVFEEFAQKGYILEQKLITYN